MSHITSAVIHVAVTYGDIDLAAAITSRSFKVDAHGYADQYFAPLSTEHVGAAKYFYGDIYAGSFNHVDPGEIAAWFEGLDWDKDDVALLSLDQEGEYQLVVFRSGGTSRRMAYPSQY